MTTSTVEDADLVRRKDLAQFLKTRRAKRDPVALGIRTGSRRRAPGLLREEVAQIAGISTTWYTWMEQARPTNPSVRVLDLLANALGLDAAERLHLFRLARPDLEETFFPPGCSAAREKLAEIARSMMPLPAYVTNGRSDLLAWNRSAGRLFGEFYVGDPVRGNILARLFLDPNWRTLFPDWECIAESAVAQYRAGTVGQGAEALMLAERLARESAQFAMFWERRDVRLPLLRTKVLDHPELGRMTFTYAALRLDGDDDLRLTLYTPAEDEPSGLRLAKLLAEGA